MLLGNKLDIAEENVENRAVLIEEAKRICSEKDIYWGGECSAKSFSFEQFKRIFENFIKKIYSKVGENKVKKQISTLKIKKKKKSCLSPD